MEFDKPVLMTCKIGRFTFDRSTSLSIRKLVRDTVMGQMLNPKQREMTVETADDAYSFIRASDSQLIAGVDFELELTQDVLAAQFERGIRDLAEASRVTAMDIKQLAAQFRLSQPRIVAALMRYKALALLSESEWRRAALLVVR